MQQLELWQEAATFSGHANCTHSAPLASDKKRIGLSVLYGGRPVTVTRILACTKEYGALYELVDMTGRLYQAYANEFKSVHVG